MLSRSPRQLMAWVEIAEERRKLEHSEQLTSRVLSYHDPKNAMNQANELTGVKVMGRRRHGR